MKKSMKTGRLITGLVVAGCTLGASPIPPSARATVSDADFNALKSLVQPDERENADAGADQ